MLRIYDNIHCRFEGTWKLTGCITPHDLQSPKIYLKSLGISCLLRVHEEPQQSNLSLSLTIPKSNPNHRPQISPTLCKIPPKN